MTAKKEFPAKRGRKPRPDDLRGKPMTLFVLSKTREQLDKYAALMGTSLSEAAVMLIECGFDAVPKENWDVLERIQIARKALRP